MNVLNKNVKTCCWLGIFGIAMGLLEAVVVVYLRELYYPQGFSFPLEPILPHILKIELLREITTIIMLVAVAMLAGTGHLRQLSYFLFSFGVWDIFYYIGLKLFLNWPTSFLTWDVLFLIPVTWLGPVLAPLICSVTMIFLAISILYLSDTKNLSRLQPIEWALMTGGAILIFVTFIWDYSGIIIQGGFLGDFFGLPGNERFNRIISQFVPTFYNWYLFILGELFIIGGWAVLVKRTVFKNSVGMDKE